ncbi:hypothetical protein BGW42_003461 [Actinomortierella wolfii]|nr:hypothetical protein BGW42_003461 [Actinomortierella wolfii]
MSEVEDQQKEFQWQSISLKSNPALPDMRERLTDMGNENCCSDDGIRPSLAAVAPKGCQSKSSACPVEHHTVTSSNTRSQDDTEPRMNVDTPTSTKECLSPSTRLYLVLSIYTFLVLTTIIISEFLVLYTQSPLVRGGLGFSAKMLGQLLTVRGIFKLLYTVFGYPRMTSRWGLIRCLRAGILTIGFASVVGLGFVVPWVVKESIEHTSSIACLQRDTQPVLSVAQDIPIQVLPSDNNVFGANAVLLTICIIAIGDALGYISVLVLFGECVEHIDTLKTYATNGRKSHATNGGAHNGTSSSSSSGVLWGLAQVTTNFMRLAGPVIAG